MEGTRILIIDDEPSIVHVLEMALKKEGFHQLFFAYNAREAIAMIDAEPFDFIILDVMLPDQSGFNICPTIREKTDAFILFLTAKVSDLDRILGFALGGDDYITKPFNPLEVVARINAKLRRQYPLVKQSQLNERKKNTDRFDFGRFQVDEAAGELIIEGKLVECPPQVFQLLLHFCKYPNHVFSKEHLLEAVWGFQDVSDDNTVMVHIRRLREKIEENPSEPKYLVTLRGLGYKLVKESQKK